MRGRRAARILGTVGRTLITAGVLLLLFVAYQLWGTGLRTSQAQNRLEDDLERALAEVAPATTTTHPTLPVGPPTAPPSTVAPLAPENLPADGEAAGRIEVAALGLDWVFVQGVSVADLRKGPGHYPQTPMPGQAGNVAIAGHRTTYGAPFNRIDEIEPGDEITLTTVQGRFRYRMTEQRVVAPSEVGVLDPVPGANVLTLTSCHPKYSARQRIIVRAELVGDPLPAVVAPQRTTRPAAEATIDDPSQTGDAASRWPAIAWGAGVLATWVVTAFAARRWRRWPAYGIAVVPFTIVLFLFFEQVARLLPASY
jgi:sortase A